jgi:putative transposase
MVRPAQRRLVVSWARRAYQVSERRACLSIGVSRSSIRYRSVRPDQAPLRRRLRELASVRVRAGYRTLHTFLRREGWPVNHKRVYRLYSEEGLPLKRQRRRRHRSAVVRIERPAVTARNQQWAMDFMHDTLAGGAKIRVLTAIDLFSRECVALMAAETFSGAQVSALLVRAGIERGGLPSRIRVDNGTEFTSKALDHWAYWNHVQLDFSRPGKPVDNAFVEAFNASVRRECLSQHWFLGLEEAQATLDAWKEDYNNHRPHSSLGQLSPARYRAGESSNPDRSSPETLASAGPGLG